MECQRGGWDTQALGDSARRDAGGSLLHQHPVDLEPGVVGERAQGIDDLFGLHRGPITTFPRDSKCRECPYGRQEKALQVLKSGWRKP